MGTDRALKDGPPTLLPEFQMTRDLALSLLRTGSNGDQILQILETIASPEGSDAEPTDQEIQF